MLVIKEYNRDYALRYARRWALDRNPLFFNFNGIGGDCTNFVSQCIFAGSCVMNYTPVYGWYYISSNDRAAAWSGVQYFYNFISANQGVGPFATEVDAAQIELGDVIQLGNQDGLFYHTVIVTQKDGDNILIASHSDDYYNRPLNTYDYAYIRYLHINGIRFETTVRELCFETLISGGVSPNEESEDSTNTEEAEN